MAPLHSTRLETPQKHNEKRHLTVPAKTFFEILKWLSGADKQWFVSSSTQPSVSHLGRPSLLNASQDKARVGGTKLGQSPTQSFAYPVWLWGIAIVCTTSCWPPKVSSAGEDWLWKNVDVEA